jgi:tetratricopeptide (TPR) repeat protein
MQVYQTKITAPHLKKVVARERLFHLLDESGDCPVTWVSSPAGSGKTTLVASYIKERNIPALWYRVDEADGDVASFFYYMGEGAKQLRKGRNKPLPLFTPEYHTGMFAFTRHYFESLFSRMSVNGAIVLDNYQDAPEESEFHEIIKNGLNLVPEGIRVFVVSRREPPSSFISLKAGSVMSNIDWEDVRFTLEEVQEMVHYRKKGLSEEAVHRIHEDTQGWAAAIILMLDGKEINRTTTGTIGESSVFDYLAIEVFHRLDQRTKDFLLQTALLPSVSPEIAYQLTGMEESSAILTYLTRNNHFIDRYGNEYRYHQLFREFLTDQAKKAYRSDELLSFIIKAGKLLAQSGQTEEAIGLFLDINAFEDALPLILGYVRTLLGQGRSVTLEEWAEKLPDTIKDNTPWLSYWLGMGKLITDPTGAKQHMEKAFSLFEAGGDHAGCLLSAAGAINSIVLEWDDYKPLDRWIDWIDNHVDPETPFPAPEIEAFIASAMVCGITWRTASHPKATTWIKRTLRACELVEDPAIRFMAKGNVVEYYCALGYFEEMYHVAEELRQGAFSSSASPHMHFSYMVRAVQLHDWINSSWEETLQLIRNAIIKAEEMGAYLHLAIIYTGGIVAAFEMGNLELVKDFIKKMEQVAVVKKQSMQGRLCSLRSMYYFLQGDIAAARRDAEDAVKIALETGVPYAEAHARIKLAYILRAMGERERAAMELEKVDSTYKPVGIVYPLYLVWLTRASIYFDEINIEKGRTALAEAFRIGREKGYAFTFYNYWQREEMARLCREALSAGIEVEYAKEVIRKHNLIPDALHEELQEWPWPCRIRAMGQFGIIMNGEMLQPSGKIQKRPVALLKALISLGGKDVRQETIEEALWPQAEGDNAGISFKTNLSRLRKLLGNEGIVEVKEGKVSLNKNYVWLDAWAMESLTERISEVWAEQRKHKASNELSELSAALVNIYQGDFLCDDDDPWAIPYRNKLRERFLAAVENLGNMLNQAGDNEKARFLYEAVMERGLPQK